MIITINAANNIRVKIIIKISEDVYFGGLYPIGT